MQKNDELPAASSTPPAADPIRRARLNDLQGLLAMEALFPTDRISRRNFRRLLTSNTADVLVYEAHGEICGNVIVLYRRRQTSGRLYSLIVHPLHQRKGIARALVQAADEAALRRGCTHNKLEVRTDNGAAIKLYESAGYESIAVRENYYEDGTAAVCMRKRLAP